MAYLCEIILQTNVPSLGVQQNLIILSYTRSGCQIVSEIVQRSRNGVCYYDALAQRNGEYLQGGHLRRMSMNERRAESGSSGR